MAENFIIVYRFLNKLCGNHHIAKEMTQETVIKAFIHIDGLRENCKLSVGKTES